MNTTPERVKAIAQHLKRFLTDMELQVYVEDAVVEVAKHKVKSEADREKLQRYLAAHYASLNIRRTESHSTHDMSAKFGTELGQGLNSTEYGQEYLRYLKLVKPATLRVM